MTLLYLLDRVYWGVIILVPLGYAFLNFQAFKVTRRPYLFFMCLVSISQFFTGSLSYLIRNSAVIQGDISHIRHVLLAITLIRSPLDLWLYSRLLSEFAVQRPGSDSPEQPHQSEGPAA